MRREAATVEIMIRRYCRDKHQGRRYLCAECRDLLAYAQKRLAACPFQEGKTTCGKCRVHCYKPAMRSRIREVMRNVGPRLVLTNPILSLLHALDGLRKEPLGNVKKQQREVAAVPPERGGCDNLPQLDTPGQIPYSSYRSSEKDNCPDPENLPTTDTCGYVFIGSVLIEC